MNFFKGFFRRFHFSKATAPLDHPKPPSDRGSEESEPPELVPVIRALELEQFDDVIELAEPLTGHLDLRIRADAARLTALALSRLDRYDEAVPWWQNLVALEPSGHNFLQLASSAAMVNRLDVSEPAFERAATLAQESGQENPSLLPMMWANYATALDRGGNTPRALYFIELLKRAYAGYRITDSHFLYMRGMPFFEVFLEHALPMLHKLKTREEIEAWLNDLNDNLDEDGQATIAGYRSQT